jgi:hypothetical protein
LRFERYIADFVFVLRMNRENIRSPARSIANLEFHHVTDEINEVARKIVATLERVALQFEIDSPGGMSPASKFAVFYRFAVANDPLVGNRCVHRYVRIACRLIYCYIWLDAAYEQHRASPLSAKHGERR